MTQNISTAEYLLTETSLPALEQKFQQTVATAKVSEVELAAADNVLRQQPAHAAGQLLFGLCALTLDNPALVLQAVARMAQGDMFATKRWLHGALVTRVSNKLTTPKMINIGGGPRFEHPGWRNYDASQSPLNPAPVQFHDKTNFSEGTGSCDVVYSSHCIEHLDDVTVSRLLAEGVRVLKKNGYLLLKLPDWDTAVKKAREADWDWLGRWGIKKVARTWPSKGLKETPNAYAAMIHCGYWTESHAGFNGHFGGGRILDNEVRGYHGPPVFSDAEYDAIFRTGSPREITRLLRDGIKESEQIHFNHRNAWANSDIISLGETSGLRWIDAPPAEIVAFMGHVPTITEMFSISNYFLFEKSA